MWRQFDLGCAGRGACFALVSSDCGRSSGHLEPHLFEIQRPTAENRERADDVQHDERRDRDAIAAGQVKNPARGDWTERGAEGEEHPGDAHYRAEAPDAVCGELLISPESAIRHTQAIARRSKPPMNSCG